MTNPRHPDLKTRLLGKRVRNGSVAIQLPFFGKRFLAATRRSRTISKSSLPSQNSITSLAKAIRCSTWKLNGRPRRRHISSKSARCSSDMRMLNRRFFFATCKGCQSKEINSWRKRVDKGRHWLRLRDQLVSRKSQEFSGQNGEAGRKLL